MKTSHNQSRMRLEYLRRYSSCVLEFFKSAHKLVIIQEEDSTKVFIVDRDVPDETVKQEIRDYLKWTEADQRNFNVRIIDPRGEHDVLYALCHR